MSTEIKQAVARELVACGSIYNRPASKDLVEIYAACLADRSAEEVTAAFRNHLRDAERGQYFPKPADLIHQLNAMKPSLEQAAMLAWAEVPVLLRNSRAAKSADPVTERVIQDLGGWVWLGQKTAQELVWIAKEFAQRYEMYAQYGTELEAISGPRTGLRLAGGVAGLLSE